ncbi:septin SPR28 KNAG_0A04440 [Huiozyma naganishii CBS 8797]|uniref:Septin-type G domain-containing protein n=1 Tax=Huiozyma naganishii (strain ATCC MYA-139 / BCRC 22969 / CBS 8797 / KCTC 17520 / NBRC 10181 / NCYC 3082 / Yp74L-3) TaxID=1071383 RepID=J7RTN9_HUIN7|nr:hypothetical protein KNAG_0A04440 [Kazachstania naganishii CBS 8797]CCK68117.1 hypothetical protein KNAG_0A04440 [Kazachstania naganishii CBS 8797]
MLNTEEIRHRRYAQKGVQFNMLLLGPRGIGKKTFLSNLCQMEDIAALATENNSNRDSKLPYTNYAIKIQEMLTPVALNVHVFDIGLQINNAHTSNKVRHFIQEFYDRILADEIKISRDKKTLKQSDGRIHVCLYFIDGNSNGLNELDIDMLSKIKEFVNIFIVIGKADRYRENELQPLKENIRRDLEANNLRSFPFGDDRLRDIFPDGEDTLISDIHPFAVICGDRFESTDPNNGEPKSIFRYNYLDEKISVERRDVSNFIYLKGILLGSHLHELKETTNDIFYEKYRTKKLLEQKNSPAQQEDKENESRVGTRGTTLTSESMDYHAVDPDHQLTCVGTVYEKNQIIEAYQNKIVGLEKMIHDISEEPSPATKTVSTECE